MVCPATERTGQRRYISEGLLAEDARKIELGRGLSETHDVDQEGGMGY